jgi:hypothetical protein
MSAVLDFSMHVMMDEKRNVPEISVERLQIPVHPGSETLRRAIRGNIVSFPSQIPSLLKQPAADTQWRIVLLFFVRGWSASRIAARFNVPRHRIWKILNGWSVRALALGHIQVIDPEAFAACCHLDVEYGAVDAAEEIESTPVPWRLPEAVPAVQGLAEPAGTRPGNGFADVPVTSADPIGALDAAIAQCEAWRDEFWVRTATLLRELRAVAAALELQRSSEQAADLFTALERGNSSLGQGIHVREEERVFHAVV